MEEEIDIYAFPDATTCNENDKCEHCVKLETKLDDLTSRFEQIEKNSKILENNYSSLLLTAKAEVSRKERMIEDLRRQLNDRAFRRGEYRHDAQVSKPISATVSGVHVPVAPAENTKIIKDVVPRQETVDVSEYICNSEPYIKDDDDDDVLQKYEPSKIFDTVYSQRLRRKLEDEKEKERMKKDQESQQPLEGPEKISKPPVPNESECNLKCNIDNKENMSSSNQLQKHSATLISQTTLNEDNSSKNRPVLVNKSSIKRSSEDNEETVPVKRTKVETGYDNFRENWGVDSKTEQAAKHDQKSETCNTNGNFSKLNERNDKSYDRKIEDSSQNSYASRLYQISEQSVPAASERRRDLAKRDRDNLEKERHELDYCKNKCDKDKYDDSARCFDKFDKDRDPREKGRDHWERDRDPRDKYKDRFESKRYERDYHKHDRLEKRRRDNLGKFNESRHERERKSEKYGKRRRRSESLSPKRIHPRQRDSQRDFKDNFGPRNQKINTHEEPNWRDKLERPNEKESKLIIQDFNSRRQRRNNGNYAGRSKSCSERTRSRSKGRDVKINDPSKKISLENYRARRGEELRGNSSEKGKRKSEEKQKDQEDFTNNKRTSVEKDFRNEHISEPKTNSGIETNSERKNSRPSSIVEEPITHQELEQGEILSPSKPEFSGKESTEKFTTVNVPGLADIHQTDIVNINKMSDEKEKIEKLPEKGNKIEKSQEKRNKTEKLHEKEDKIEKLQEKGNKTAKIQENRNIIEKIQKKLNIIEKMQEKRIEKESINKPENIGHSKKETHFPVENKLEKNYSANNPILEIKPPDNCKSEMVKEIIGEILNTTFERHVQSLDSFIESAEKVLEEKKEGYSAEQISREVANELRQELKITITEETNKIQTLPKLQQVSSPVKNKKKIKTAENKESEITNSVKEGKRCQLKSKEEEEEEEKNDSRMAKEKEVETAENSKQKILSLAKQKIENSVKEGKGCQQLKSIEEENDSIRIKEKEVKITENLKYLLIPSSVKESKLPENLKYLIPSLAKDSKLAENFKYLIPSLVRESKLAENSKHEIQSSVKEKIANSTKEGKRSHQLKSKEEVLKNNTNAAKENQAKIPINSKPEISNPAKENKIAENSKPKISSTEQQNKIESKKVFSENVLNSPGESCSSEVKKKPATTKVSNLPEGVGSKPVPKNIIKSTKGRRKNTKETQKPVQALQKINEQSESKEQKKTQKSKPEITDTKTKAKKPNEKLMKKIVVNRRRPVILTDTNASKTIVAKENVIMKIDLNTSGEKNNISS